MVVLTVFVLPGFKNDGTEAALTPANSTELFGIIILPVNQVSLVKDLLGILQTNAVLLFNDPALRSIKPEPHI